MLRVVRFYLWFLYYKVLKVSSPENEDQVLFLGLFGLVCGVVQSVATVVWGEHVHKVLVWVLDSDTQVSLQDLVSLVQNDVLEVFAEAEKDGLLPLSLLVFICLSLTHFHVIEDGNHFICYFHTGGLQHDGKM